MKMKIFTFWLTVVLVTGSGFGRGVSLSDAMAVESLNRGALDLLSVGQTSKGRAPRLAVLLQYAARLNPDDFQTQELLSFIYDTQKKSGELLDSLEICMKAAPQDFQVSRKWLDQKLVMTDRVPERVEFLRDILDDNSKPRDLRVLSAVMMGATLRGTGDDAGARQAFEKALELDSTMSIAYSGLASVSQQVTPSFQAKAIMSAIYENPRDLKMVVTLARMLQTFGLGDESVKFFDYAWKLTQKLAPDIKPDHDIMVQYCNAMLDAGMYAKAIEFFTPFLTEFPTSTLLRSLLIEAARKVQDKAIEEKLIGEIQTLLEHRKITEGQSPDFMAEIAMFYLFTMNDPAGAMEYTRQLAVSGVLTDEGKRIISSAQLFNDNSELSKNAELLLRQMASDDPFAALFLARFFYNRQADAKGSDFVKLGLSLSRSGQAGRELKDLAALHAVKIEDPTGYTQFKNDIADFNDEYFKIGLEPEKYVIFEIRPQTREYAVDQPLSLDISLKNLSGVPIVIGATTLFPTTAAITVSLPAPPKQVFNDVVITHLPAPRILEPNESVSKTIRIDVGQAGLWLKRNSLAKVAVDVTGKLVYSTGQAALLESSPAKVVRQGLLGEADLNSPAARQAYQQALGVIVGMMQESSLEYRVNAAKRVGRLLVIYDAARTAKVALPTEFVKILDRRLFIRLVQECLKDESDVVRAEMISQLLDVRMDRLLMKQLEGLISDESSLVRLRLVELIGTCSLGGQAPLIDHFAQNDPYDLVRELASRLGKYDYSPRATR